MLFFRTCGKKIVTTKGERRWSCEGATVYNWNRNYEHILQRHRFAMLPSEKNTCNFSVIRPEKWYVHVYQTKIEIQQNILRTLSSRKMARYLSNNRWDGTYWPRNIDIGKKKGGERKTGVVQHRVGVKDPKMKWKMSGSD